MATSLQSTGRVNVAVGRGRIAMAVVVFILAVVAFDRIFFAAFQLAQAPVDRRSELTKKLVGLPNKAQYEMLVLGTSRTYEAVHPAYISKALGIKAYKEAYQGKGPRYNFEFYQLYKEIVGRPKWVVYGVDYFLFEVRSEQWAMDRFNVRADTSGSERLVHGGPLLTLANKAADDRAIVRTLDGLQERASSTHGEFNPERNIEDMEAYLGPPVYQPTGREPVVRFDPKPFPPFPGIEGEYLTRLLDQWETEGVAVMLINTPDYIRSYETNTEHDKFVACFRQLAQSRRHIVFVDYSNPSIFPLERAGYFAEGGLPVFSTNSHLSKEGVLVFNRLFLPDLKRFVDTNPRAEVQQ